MPGGVRHRRVAQRDWTVPSNIRRALRGVARPWQPRHRERCHACGRALPQNLEILLRARVGKGRNTMLRRGCCASPVSESVHSRLGFSRVIEE